MGLQGFNGVLKPTYDGIVEPPVQYDTEKRDEKFCFCGEVAGDRKNQKSLARCPLCPATDTQITVVVNPNA